MFAIAIPLVIFALPFLLKKLDCTLAPVELGDGSVACVLHETGAFAKVEARDDDEDPENDLPLSAAVAERTIESRNTTMDRELTEEQEPEPEPEQANDLAEKTDATKPLETGEQAPTELDANGIEHSPSAEPSEASSQRFRSARRTSSRVASLRAAFEQADAPTASMKRRFQSSDRSSNNSVEGGRDSESEIGRLKDELEKESEMRIAYEEKVTTLEDEVEELNAQLSQRDDVWREELERRSQQEKSEAKGYQMEVINVQRQLAELKRDISNSTRTITQVSDTALRLEIETLQYEVQNWVVNHFRRVRVEVSSEELCTRLRNVAETDHFERLERIYRNFDSAAKLPILQATVTIYLLDIFTDPYLYCLTSELPWVERSREAAEALRSILPTAVYHRWRANTFDALRQCDSMKSIVQDTAHKVSLKINKTLNAVAALEPDDARVVSLKTIANRVIDLAHLVRVQQAQYDFDVPDTGAPFDGESMDDISDESDAKTGCTVRYATFISAVKVGNEDGEHLEPRKVLVKAKVLCDHLVP